MNFYLSYLKKLDWVLIASACVVAIFGLASIWSSSMAKGSLLNFEKQIVFFIVGLAAMFLMSFLDYRIFRNNSYLILVFYFVSLALLAGLFFFAPEIRGIKGWYKIGILSLDPIEPAKIALMFILAKYFSMRHAEMYKFRHIIFSGLYVFFPALLVFLKPDLGGAMILVAMWLGVLFISGIKINHFIILLLCFALVAGMAWVFLLKDYQKDRISSFLFPVDPLGGSWSQAQAKVAIGSGQIWGQGLGNGSQVQYGFLPEPHTDFIFSAIAEETGLAGILVMFFAYGIMVWRVVGIAVNAKSNFPRLFASGFAIVLISQFFINIGMNLGLLPVVGIYLPLVSYGGSGLIGNFICFGILQSIYSKK